MKKVKTVIVAEDGKVVIDGLPVKKGDKVEVTVRKIEAVVPTHPLRGLPVHLDDPFGPATDESEWNVLK